MRLMSLLGVVLLFCVISSCNQGEQELQRFSSLPSKSTGIAFSNDLIETDSINAYTFLYMYNGAGVGIGDINNDGLSDVFFSGNMTSSKLYLNQGDFRFADITASAGVTTDRWVHGVSMVDINADGFLDIYLSVGGVSSNEKSKNLLFINNGNETFTEASEQLGLAENKLTTQSAFFDYDKDGDLDVYMINYENNASKDPNTIRPKRVNGYHVSGDKLYRNDGDVGFTDVSKQAGIDKEGYGLGLGISDFNGDGWPDVYVSNDFLYDDFLYINDQKGGFEDRSSEFLRHTSNFGMGIDIADINNDGLMDIMQVDMLPEDNTRQKKLLGGMNYNKFMLSLDAGYAPQYMRNSLQINNGSGIPFSEVSQVAGIHMTDWSWSPLMADFDNDGLKDILITNGYAKDVTDIDFRNYIANEMRSDGELFDSMVVIRALETLTGNRVPNYLYQNRGDFDFTNRAEDWGMGEPSFSTGAAYGDLDNDGDLDVLISNINQKAFVYRNNTNELDSLNYFRVKVDNEAMKGTSLGIRVDVFSNGQIKSEELNPFRGFQSSVEPVLHFGFGRNQKVDSVKTTWLDGHVQLNYDLEMNSLFILKRDKESLILKSPLIQPQTIFKDVTAKSNALYKHKESSFVDFNREPLLPHKLSENGPCSAVGDINNDGYEDFFVGGAAGESGVIFYQKKGGSFFRKALNMDVESEDVNALFFDFDRDGDLDLYVASGSNEFEQGSPFYQDRLYANDGKGNFIKTAKVLPDFRSSSSVVVPTDFDADGDIDLFVGGALSPGSYPLPGESHLLRNNKGVFEDVTQKLAPELAKIGMVRDAKWADINGNWQNELVVVGEFMSINVFQWEGRALVNKTNEYKLNQYTGWWNTLEVADVDSDGDLDLIVGNHGLNSRYKASSSEPLTIYADDFDGNGRIDAVMTHFVQGVEQLVHDKVTLSSQINSIKKRFPKNYDYASKSFQEIFKPEDLKNAYRLSVNHFESSVFLNRGNGEMELMKLPVDVQFSNVKTIQINDFNADGHPDLLLGGNSFAPEVFTGRNDAQATVLLAGNGDGTFYTIKPSSLGLSHLGVVSAMKVIEINNSPHFLVFRNNERLKIYQPQLKKRIVKEKLFVGKN